MFSKYDLEDELLDAEFKLEPDVSQEKGSGVEIVRRNGKIVVRGRTLPKRIETMTTERRRRGCGKVLDKAGE